MPPKPPRTSSHAEVLRTESSDMNCNEPLYSASYEKNVCKPSQLVKPCRPSQKQPYLHLAQETGKNSNSKKRKSQKCLNSSESPKISVSNKLSLLSCDPINVTFSKHETVVPFNWRKSHLQGVIHRNVNGGGGIETALYPRTCNVCQKVYSSKNSYSAHFRLKRCAPNQKGVKEAETPDKFKSCTNKLCDFKYKTIDELLKHLDECCLENTCKIGNEENIQEISSASTECKIGHEEIIEETISANTECNKIDNEENFQEPSSANNKDLIVCPDCSSAYSNSSSYSKHFRTCLNTKVQFTKCIEGKCQLKFRTYSDMLKHLENTHKVDLGVQNLSFPSMEEFYSRKKVEEQNSFAMYVKNRENLHSVSGETHYYVCKFDVKSRADSSPKTCRKKFNGETIKNTNCPSRMFVTEKTDCVVVKYISCHNHELKFKNLKHYRWNQDTKNIINYKLGQEIPSHKIKEDLGAPSIDLARTKEHFITTTQISKMKYEFNSKNHLHKNDATSVHVLVNSLEGEEKDSLKVKL